jgi:hypothetical protein
MTKTKTRPRQAPRPELPPRLAKDLPLPMLQCRTYGHAWNLVELIRVSVGRALILDCARCTTRRTDDLNLAGKLVGRVYAYAEGYHLDEKLSRDEFRKLLMKRTTTLIAPGARRKVKVGA